MKYLPTEEPIQGGNIRVWLSEGHRINAIKRWKEDTIYIDTQSIYNNCKALTFK